MAWTDPYYDVTEFKARLGITGSGQDAVLQQAIDAASRQVESWAGRVFNKTETAVARYFTAKYGDLLELPDFISVSEIAVDGGARTWTTVWAATDYDLYPFDADDDGKPYTEIRTAPTGTLLFGSYPRGVRVTAIWGWPEVPAVIREATALQATRLYKRKDAPFGVIGSTELGQFQTISKIDPDVLAMVAPYRPFAY